MKSFSVPRWHIGLLMVLALVINIAFLGVNYRRYFGAGLTLPHGEIGYNIYRFGNIKTNPSRLKMMHALQIAQQKLIDFAEVDHTHYNEPTEFRSINDTVGYGVILGLLWKLTGSLEYADIQWLQVIIFCLLISLIYAIGLYLFGNARCALLCSLSLLACLPLIFLNIHPLRDIWAFYGLVILIYALLASAYRQMSVMEMIWWSFCFAVCQWVRPTIFFTLMALFPLLWVYKKKALKSWIVFLAGNIFLFWLPFLAYNKIAYDHYFVSCAGQDLYEGLGEFSNPWGIKMDDAWFDRLMQEKHKIPFGTPAYQAKAATMFFDAVRQHPGAYLMQIIRRIPQLFNFCATMIYEPQEYEYIQMNTTNSLIKFWAEIMRLLEKAQKRVFYGRLYLLLGWIALAVLWLHKKRFETFLLIIIAVSAASKFLSHLEPRYLLPHYAFFAFAIGFLLNELWVMVECYMKYQQERARLTPRSIGEL